LYQAKDVKTTSVYTSPRRAANEGGESPSFSSFFHWEKERNLTTDEVAFLFYDPFPPSSSVSLKIRDDSCFIGEYFVYFFIIRMLSWLPEASADTLVDGISSDTSSFDTSHASKVHS
jgi:hypothetical protein